MNLQQLDHFFPGRLTSSQQPDHSCIYRIDFSEGYGQMTAREVMPGVTLFLNDFHTSCGYSEEARCPGLVEINHCQAGRFECTMRDGRSVWLGPQDFAISDMGRPPVQCRFSHGLYQGISLTVEPKAAEAELTRMFGEGVPSLVELFGKLLEERSFLLLRSDPKIQGIFSDLSEAPKDGRTAYYRLKIAELMFYLHDRQKAAGRTGFDYYSKHLSERICQIEAKLTEDLRSRLPLSRLAEEYQLGESTIKKYFLQIYGEPPYTYLKRRRMEEAAFLLVSTSHSISQIADAVGYLNASKFSAAFRNIYGLSPTEYRRYRRLGDGK